MLNKNVIIPNIKCYNEPQDYTGGTEYVSCFYSDLFSYLISNNKNIIPFIANNVFYYDYTPSAYDLRKRYGIVAKSIKNTSELALEQGLKVTNEKVDTSNIFNYIKYHIDLMEPVSVAVDMFELSYRLDRYQKIHTIHYFMIYGYNDNDHYFYILDNPTNTYYKKVICSYADLERGYKGGKVLSKDMDVVCLSIFNDKISDNNNDYKSVFIKNYIANEENIMENLKGLSKLKSDFKNICMHSLYTDRGLNLFYLIHYQLMNMKRAELFAYYKILHDKCVLITFKEIVDNWEKVRNILNYCLQKKELDIKKINNAVSIIGELCNKEYIFYNDFFKYIKSIV